MNGMMISGESDWGLCRVCGNEISDYLVMVSISISIVKKLNPLSKSTRLAICLLW